MNELIEEMDELVGTIEESWLFMKPFLQDKKVDPSLEMNFELIAEGVRQLNTLFKTLRSSVN